MRNKLSSIAALAMLSLSSIALAQYGATVAKPYTQADVDYGRKLQAKIDKARADSVGAIAKMPIEPL